MKIRKNHIERIIWGQDNNYCDNNVTDVEILNTILDYFAYSMKDIKSYTDLTDTEKEIIGEKVFEEITM